MKEVLIKTKVFYVRNFIIVNNAYLTYIISTLFVPGR